MNKKIISNLLTNFFVKTYFLHSYYVFSDLLWQEGLMFDFLQKKFVDAWVRKFVIYSAYLFSEKLMFDSIVKFYLNLLIWPLHKYNLFDLNSVSSIFFFTLLILYFFFALFSLFLLYEFIF